MKISHKLTQFAAQMGRGCSRPLYKFLRDMFVPRQFWPAVLDVGSHR